MIAWGCGEHGENGRCQAYLLWLCGRLCESWRGRAGWEGHTTNKGGDCLPHLWSRVWKFEVGSSCKHCRGTAQSCVLEKCFSEASNFIKSNFSRTFFAPFYIFWCSCERHPLWIYVKLWLHAVRMCEGVACKDIEAIRDLCTEKGWWLVEDRPGKAGEKGEFSKRNGSLTLQDICEAMGTRADNGELVGTFGDFAVTSSPGLIVECFRGPPNSKIVNTQYVLVSMSLEYTTLFRAFCRATFSTILVES